MLYMVVPRGQSLGPLNGPNCIPKDPPVVTAWGTFDGAFPLPHTRCCRVCLHDPKSQQAQGVDAIRTRRPERFSPPPVHVTGKHAGWRGEDLTDVRAYRMWHLRRLHTGERYHRHIREPGGDRAGCLLVMSAHARSLGIAGRSSQYLRT
jgi:hypothetical protein